MEDMVLENVVSIDSLCRTCMRHDDGENMLSLFDSVVTMGEGVLTPLSQMLGDFIRMEVTNIDELPKKICLNCVEHVKQSFIFWQQCRSSFHSLKQLIRPSVDCEVDPNEKCTQTDSVSLHQCEMCDKFFSDYEEMKKHRMHHKSDGFRCKFCGKSYTRLSYLKGHMAVVHTSSQVPATSFSKKCCCPVCGKQFTRPEHMRRHMLLHENGFEMKPEEELTPSDDNVDFGDDHHQADDDFVEEVDAKNNLTMPEVHIIEDPTEAQISSVPVGDVVDNDENVNKDEDSQYVPEDDQTEFTEIDESDKSTTKTSSKSKAPLTNDKQCPECNKMFTRATHLRRHMTVHTDVKAFNCNVCHKGFTRSDHLHIHMRNHTGEHPFRCEPCNKEFKRRERHTAHMKKYHATDKVTSTTGKVSSNVTVDPATVCNVCQKPFSSVKYMKIHAKTHIDNFTCKTCSIKCENRSELQKHVKTHINERPFLCSECGLRFVRADYLVVHMRRHKGEKPYKCKFCNKGFPRATDLTVHERYHTGEKTHLCTICGKGFQRAYNLLVHMRIHTGEKPYHCPHCVKSFAQGNDLKAHIRRHTGERYKCDKCDAGFIQGYHLTQHKRTVHNLDVKSHIRRVEKFISTDAKEELNEEDDEMVAGDVNDCEQREYDIIENFIEEPIHIKMEPTASGHIEPNSMDETTSYHSEEVPVSIYYIRETK